MFRIQVALVERKVDKESQYLLTSEVAIDFTCFASLSETDDFPGV